MTSAFRVKFSVMSFYVLAWQLLHCVLICKHTCVNVRVSYSNGLVLMQCFWTGSCILQSHMSRFCECGHLKEWIRHVGFCRQFLKRGYQVKLDFCMICCSICKRTLKKKLEYIKDCKIFNLKWHTFLVVLLLVLGCLYGTFSSVILICWTFICFIFRISIFNSFIILSRTFGIVLLRFRTVFPLILDIFWFTVTFGIVLLQFRTVFPLTLASYRKYISNLPFVNWGLKVGNQSRKVCFSIYIP